MDLELGLSPYTYGGILVLEHRLSSWLAMTKYYPQIIQSISLDNLWINFVLETWALSLVSQGQILSTNNPKYQFG